MDRGIVGKRQRSLQIKLLFPVVIGALVVMGGLTMMIKYIQTKQARLTGLSTARAVTHQLQALQTLYSSTIVPRAEKQGLSISDDFVTRDDSLPTPPAFTQLVSESLPASPRGVTVRFYSRDALTTQKPGQFDAFTLAALQAVVRQPQTPYYALEQVRGQLTLRYVTADIQDQVPQALSQSSPNMQPSTAIRNVIEVMVPVTETASLFQAETIQLVGLPGIALALLAGLIMFSIHRTVIRPLRALADTSERIRAGDLQARAVVKTQDEVGIVASGFNTLVDQFVMLLHTTQAEHDGIAESVRQLQLESSRVARGDLTCEAQITADVTGEIASAFNTMITQLRAIIMRVHETTLQLNNATHEIQDTATHLASGSETQAAQIIDSAAALDEMAVSIEQVSEHASLSTTVANQALSTARRGKSAVQHTLQGMHRVRDQAHLTSQHLNNLGERSQDIGSAVQLINDIADRTSVLALNASIEAALAGETGQGFAIVATEVEHLAEQAAEATRQIVTLISTIQNEINAARQAMQETTYEVDSGVQVVSQAGQALEDVESISAQLTELIQSISLASKQQARGSENLSRAMGEISAVTQLAAQGTKQAVASINQLAQLAESLRHSVSAFTLPTNGHVHG